MSEKVVLPKEVAEAIEKVWEQEWNSPKHVVLTQFWRLSTNKYLDVEINILLKYFEENPIEYMTALVNGYTVEKTKEERLLEYVESLGAGSEMIAIHKALEILEITIPGINDKFVAELSDFQVEKDINFKGESK